MKPGSPEWRARVAAMLAEEAAQPAQWWYLSFATDTEFLGACVVRACGPTLALRWTHHIGINPGGQVMTIALGEQRGFLPPDRLFSKAELAELDGGREPRKIGQLEADGVLPGANVRFDDW